MGSYFIRHSIRQSRQKKMKKVIDFRAFTNGSQSLRRNMGKGFEDLLICVHRSVIKFLVFSSLICLVWDFSFLSCFIFNEPFSWMNSKLRHYWFKPWPPTHTPSKNKAECPHRTIIKLSVTELVIWFVWHSIQSLPHAQCLSPSLARCNEFIFSVIATI